MIKHSELSNKESCLNRATAGEMIFVLLARDEAAPESDLDICVVIKELDQKADRLLSDIAWEIGFESDVVISVVPFSVNEFNTGPLSVSPLVRIIKQEGVAA